MRCRDAKQDCLSGCIPQLQDLSLCSLYYIEGVIDKTVLPIGDGTEEKGKNGAGSSLRMQNI